MNPLANRQDKAFAAHVLDLFQTAQIRHVSCFSSFLDMHRHFIARQLAQASGYSNYLFYGGVFDAERVMLGVFAQEQTPAPELFPFVSLVLRFRKIDAIGHRDILGSLMALRIAREAVGDIFTGEGWAVFYITSATAPVVLSELKKVGRVGVTVSQETPDGALLVRQWEELQVSVSALRLDCMVAALAGVSREKSARTVLAGLVSINGVMRCEPSRPLREGDVLSIRGVGKFLFWDTGRVTKKGRLQLLCKKYS